MRYLVIAGPYTQAIGKIGTRVGECPRGTPGDGLIAYWLEFEDVIFEGADPLTQHPNRSWFFEDEIVLSV